MRKILSYPLCKTKKFSFLYLSKDRMFDLPGFFAVKKCRQCTLICIDPQPTGKELHKYYPSQQYYSYVANKKKSFFELLRKFLISHYYDKNLLTRIITTVIPNVPAIPSRKKTGKILDIGCGSGDTLLMLKGLGWDVYGLDIDRKAVETAKNGDLLMSL